jgi:5S rRNA maturation endonuclease (ribonuclease M5)
MSITQLKPWEEAFMKILMDVKRLDAIIICEGRSDVEVYKSVLRKLTSGVERRVSIGFTDAEGLRNIPEIATAIATLSKHSRRLKTLIIAIDADEYKAEDRASGLIDSLRARGIVIEGFEKHGLYDQVYVANISSNGRRLKVLILVNGDFTIPAKKHVLEDHCVKLLGIPVERSIDSSKELIGDIGACIKRIEELPRDAVCEYFRHIVEL